MISGGIVTVTGVGTVVLQATQAGNSDYNAATATQSFQVTPASLTIAANNATRSYGAANPAFSGTVSGAVGSDSFTESFTTTATTTSNVGSYTITPAVTGAQLANYIVTPVAGELTVTGAATTTKLNAPVNASYGSSVTLTATVGSTAGVPAGSVTFLSGSTSLGVAALNSSGVATLTTTTLPAGTDTTIATYAASGNFAGSSSSGVTLTVIGGAGGPGATYALAANPSTLTIAPGATGKTTLVFTPTGGYSGTIALSCLNLPANVSCAFDQSQVTLSGTNQNVSTGLSINTAAQQASKDVPSNAPQSPSEPALFALVFWCPGGSDRIGGPGSQTEAGRDAPPVAALPAGRRRLGPGSRSVRLRYERACRERYTEHRPGNCRGYRNLRKVVTQTVMLTVNMTSMTPQ